MYVNVDDYTCVCGALVLSYIDRTNVPTKDRRPPARSPLDLNTQLFKLKTTENVLFLHAAFMNDFLA